jgi:antitoxin component YwqK of YwqJK toxin-antitoxin module
MFRAIRIVIGLCVTLLLFGCATSRAAHETTLKVLPDGSVCVSGYDSQGRPAALISHRLPDGTGIVDWSIQAASPGSSLRLSREGREIGFVEKSNLNGLWASVDDNARIEDAGHFVQGRREGLWRFWYWSDKTPTLGIEAEYRKGELHGRYLEWYADGTPKYIGRYDKGRQSGEWAGFDKTTGGIWRKGRYVDGREDGPWVYWHDNGLVSMFIWYRNGEVIAPIRAWRANGAEVTGMIDGYGRPVR